MIILSRNNFFQQVDNNADIKGLNVTCSHVHV